jgi:hypothetical protein
MRALTAPRSSPRRLSSCPSRTSSPNPSPMPTGPLATTSRQIATISSRAPRSSRARNCSSTTEGSSAACRSSRISSIGCADAARLNRPAMASNREKRAASDSWVRAAGVVVVPTRSARPGTSWATWAAPVPSQAVRVCWSRSSARARIIWRHGQKGGAPPPSQQEPHNTRVPCLMACVATCSASQVLPIPGSPTTRTSRPRPPTASSRPASSSATSRSRPTKARDPGRGARSPNSAIAPVSLTPERPARYPRPLACGRPR